MFVVDQSLAYLFTGGIETRSMVSGVGREGSRFVAIPAKTVPTVWWLYGADDEGDGGCCCGGDDERQRSRRRDDCVRTDATAVAAKQPLCGGAARHRGSRRLYASPPPPPQTVAPSTPLFRRQRRPYTIYNAYVRVLCWGDFFPHFFFDRLWIVFFLLTPRRSSWPRSNGYTNDFGLIFCFPHRPSSLTHSFSLPLSLSLTLSLSVSLLPSPSIPLFSCIYLSPSIYPSISYKLTHTHIHTSLGQCHTLNDV